MGELKRVGFFLSSDDGKLLYSNPESRRGRLKSAVQQESDGGHESVGRKRKANSSSERLLKRNRGLPPTRNGPESSSSAIQLASAMQLSRYEASRTINEERMQTVEGIEDMMENEC